MKVGYRDSQDTLNKKLRGDNSMSEDRPKHLTPILGNVEHVSKGRNIVIVIGIDNCVNWPKLHNAVSDAMGIQKLFVEKLGFM
jgi:hypothetical protein